MIVLNKKRIYLILEVIIVALVVSYLKMPNNTENNTIQTVALPVTNKVIIVDAGHGYPDMRSRSTKWNY